LAVPRGARRHREATAALITAWTRTLGKMEAFAVAKRHRMAAHLK
jgi:hypothetical protein